MPRSLFDQYKAALRRGHLAALEGDLEIALEAYGEAARVVPERALPVASQGTVLHRLDRWPEATEAFDLALRMAPDDEAALRARALARAERGLISGAAADFERLAFVLDVASRSGEAAEAARRAVDLEPTPAREALALRLRAAAAQVAGLMPPGSPARGETWETAGGERGVVQDLAGAPQRLGEVFTVDVPPAPGPVGSASAALAARIAELGTQPSWVAIHDGPAVAAPAGELDADGRPWPGVDLPSPPPPRIEGPPPDPETLLAEAARLLDGGEQAAARDRMLLAAMVHREAGRLDAALEVCLTLLTTAPGDPHVHLAIANLQLDRGWTSLATEKIELLLRLTALTGDTKAEADAHGLAAERLRDDVLSATSPR